jgi:hypothetical protein
METQVITNIIVRDAFEAWQKGDAQLLDDVHIRDFNKFSTEAIGHERFTSIDKIEDYSLSIYGKFHSDTWRDFKTYFKFHINKAGKKDRLEIGQSNN